MKYGTVFYEACKATGIKPLQWLYLDMVRGLSIANEQHGYFAHASNRTYASELGVSERTVQSYSKELSQAGWLSIKGNGHRRTTQAFNQLYLQARQGEEIAPMKKLHGGGEKIAPQGVKKFHGRGEKIAPNNNSITTVDNNSNNALPFSSHDFLENWELFKAHRKEKRNKLTPTAERMALKKLEAMGEANAIASIKQTLANGWSGLFEPKDSRPASSKGKPKMTDWDAMAKAM